MARILIDCTHVDFRRQPTGIPRVVLKYIEEGYVWAEATGNEVIPVVPTPEGLFLCRPVPGEHPPEALIELEKRSNANDAAAAAGRDDDPSEPTPPPHLIVPGEGDVLFSPAYWHDNDPRFYIDARLAGARIVILVHDILPVAYKHYYHAPWRYSFAAAVLQAIGYADRLLCVSATTRQAVEDFARKRQRTLPPIGIAHNGFQPLVMPVTAKRMRQGAAAPHTDDPVALKALESDGPLLMVGSVEPKKGHIPVIRCLEAMWAAGYQRNLIVIGRTGWMEREIVDYIENSPYRGTKLFWLSGIDDYDLAYAYIRSRALVFASIAEGFGIPMIEASLLGKPVVVLDTPIAREVLGEHGRYFNEASELVRQLVALEDAATYDAACDEAETFSWPTWETCVPRVMDDLASLVEDDGALAAPLRHSREYSS